MRFKDFLYRAPAWVLLLLPLVLLVLVFAFVLSIFPSGVAGRYAVFAFLFFAILLSRMLRVWEWGVEFFHFLMFCISFACGFVFGAVFAVLSSVVMFSLFLEPRAHYFTYGAASILIQSLGILVNVVLASALSFVARGAALSNLPFFGTGVVLIALIFDKFLTNRFVGIDWGRLSVSMLVDLVLNYNLFSLFGAGAMGFLSQL